VHYCLQASHRFSILENESAQRPAINATIGGNNCMTKGFCNLQGDRLTGLIEFVDNGICINVTFGSEFKQDMANGGFSASNVACQSNDARHL
jgi:hypothetical protein